MRKYNLWLLMAALMSTLAALAHVGCVVFGAEWYRFFGAGEQMATMAASGEIYPTIVTVVITAILLIWTAYALSGAGVILRLPLLRWILLAITAVLTIRAVSFPAMMSVIPENSLTFWLVSSGICAVFAACFGIGLWQQWPSLSAKNKKLGAK